jgi:hypothetical protein
MLAIPPPADISLLENCPECKIPFIFDSGEFVCRSCGIVKPSKDLSLGAEKYGREVQSFGVVGDNLGTPHSMKDGNGQNIIYELRGRNVLKDLMWHHLEGLEEPNSATRNLKKKVVPALVRAQSKHGRQTTGSAGADISNGIKWWFREVERLSSDEEPIAGKRSSNRLENEVLILRAAFDWHYMKLFRNIKK